MLRTELLDTSAFRLKIVYLGLFGLTTIASLWLVQWLWIRFTDQQVQETVKTEVAVLLREFAAGGLNGLQRLVRQQAELEPDLESICTLIDTS